MQWPKVAPQSLSCPLRRDRTRHSGRPVQRCRWCVSWQLHLELSSELVAREPLVCSPSCCLLTAPATTASELFQHCLGGTLLEGRTVVLVTHAPEMCSRADNCELVVYLEDGKVVKTSNAHDLHADASKSAVHEHHDRHRQKSEKTDDDDEQESAENTGVSTGALSWSVYVRYLRQVGTWRFWLPYVVLNIVAHVLMLATGAWTGKWTNASDRQDRLGYYVRRAMGRHADAADRHLVAHPSRFGHRTVRHVPRSHLGLYRGLSPHSQLVLVQSTQRADPMACLCLSARAELRRFDQTPTSRIVNRASKDLSTVDTDLVEGLQPILDYAPQVALVTITIAAVLPVFLIPAALISLGFVFVGRLYVKNALAARQQVSVSRSPLLATLGDVSAGAVSVRAFGRQEVRDPSDELTEPCRSFTGPSSRTRIVTTATSSSSGRSIAGSISAAMPSAPSSRSSSASWRSRAACRPVSRAFCSRAVSR